MVVLSSLLLVRLCSSGLVNTRHHYEKFISISDLEDSIATLYSDKYVKLCRYQILPHQKLLSTKAMV